MESEGGLTSNGSKAPSIAEGIEQLCLGEELEAVVASRLGYTTIDDHDDVGHDGQDHDDNDYELVLWWSSLLWSVSFLAGCAIIIMRKIRMVESDLDLVPLEKMSFQ